MSQKQDTRGGAALQLRVLGAAAGGGSPQWNCRCDVCRLVWEGDSRVTPRTQSSIAVSVDGENWALINCAPDILKQIQQTPALHPHEGRRHTPIASVLLTNADVEHIGGVLNPRASSPFRLLATPMFQDGPLGSPVFSLLTPHHFSRVDLPLDHT